jgi:hypothetical protein
MSMAIICKFKKVDDYLLDSLGKGYIYFSHPEQLNDPFDCQINITKSLNCAIKISKGKVKEKLEQLNDEQAYLDDLNEKLSNTGVFSSSYNMHSKSLREPLLWAHYADKHKGVCLIYNIPYEYISEQSMAGVPVQYEKNPLIKFFIKWAKSREVLTQHEFIDELAKKYLGIKDKCWSYENEYRLVLASPGEFQLDKSFLEYVCYGLNTPQKDRETINSLLNNSGYEVGLLEMERTESDFGITEKKI